MAKLASQADLWYNEDLIWLWSEMVEHLRPRYKIGACTMSNTIPPTSGIYKIVCTVNGKFYIGSTANLHKRQMYHLKALRLNKHDNPHLQHAFNKYGEQSFTFEVLELVLPISLTAREQYWFNKLKPFGKRGFNILQEAGSPLGWKHTPEAIAKTRQANLDRKKSPEHNEHNRQAQLGKKMSLASSEKKRQAMLGNTHGLGYKHTPEACEKMRQTRQIKPTWQGRTHTPASIEKMRQSALARHARERDKNNG